MHNGQMGYWENRSSGAGNNEHTTRAFVAVGPSEAEKAARAEKVAKEKQQAEEAAKAFAAKTAAASAAAEKNVRMRFLLRLLQVNIKLFLMRVII
ncbi:hypothetical protein IE986_28740 [Klebsiella pneumoniae]|uniref:Uncharacterized protein n=2 Tax=Klebsiella pneumoniae TaxID=573 RepID=A0A927DG57_KLEPN|nr:hypothetical protein [Klebsiella pneumoniae]